MAYPLFYSWLPHKQNAFRTLAPQFPPAFRPFGQGLGVEGVLSLLSLTMHMHTHS